MDIINRTDTKFAFQFLKAFRILHSSSMLQKGKLRLSIWIRPSLKKNYKTHSLLFMFCKEQVHYIKLPFRIVFLKLSQFLVFC